MTPAPDFNSDFQDLFSRIQQSGVENCLLLTPNKRLSRFLHDQYNRAQDQAQNKHEQTKGAWPSLNCHSFHGWVQQQWDRLVVSGEHALSDRAALTPFQETTLWDQVLNNHPETPELLSIPSTVKLAQSAWRLMHEWHLDLNEYDDSNTKLFLSWCRAFQLACDEKGFISSVQQVNAVIEACLDQLVQTPNQVFLYGFDDFTPQMKALLESFETHGAQLHYVDIETKDCQQERFTFPDEEHEIEAAALWAKTKITQLLTTKNHLNPTDNIAIIVPNLAQHRERIERIFNQVFDPQIILPDAPQHAPGYNLSAATPLNQVPMVQIALQALSCHQQWVDIETISQLLRSPFIGVMSELDERALIDLKLRGHDFDINLKQLKATVGKTQKDNNEEHTSSACPDFYQRLSEFETALKKTLKITVYPSQWIEHFNSLLGAFGWPGNRPLDTLEYQQFQAWQETLNEYAGLDYLTHQIGFGDALKLLMRLVSQASFKAQTKDSPLQILGVLEAAGLPFSNIWFMNLDDETWPPAPNPNPLIPVALQVKMQLPQSAANRELSYSKRLTERFIKSTSHITFSYASAKDGQQLLASPLIENVPEKVFSIQKKADYAEQLFEQKQIVTSWDHCGPHVTDTKNIRGGSQLLKDQAACPFRAFARHRLHSEGLPDITIGLDASERGTLLHNALEIIWKKLRNQEKLLALSPEELEQLIVAAIDSAMTDIKSKRFVGERFIQIETERLKLQIQKWLELEKQREPFTVVMNEGKRTVKLGQLPIKIRYDRVDKLADDSLFVLDYKTGKQTIHTWGSDRPDEPQVPLYCIANQDKVSGAAFGEINADNIAIKGAAANTDIAPGLEPIEKVTVTEKTDNWDSAVSQWRSVLEKLANEFMAGAAEVNPKKPPATCQFCDLSALCRIKDQFETQEDLYE